MNSDPLQELERQLLAAAHRQSLVPSLPRRRRPRFAVAIAAALTILVMAAAALAATGLLSGGAPLGLAPGIALGPAGGIGVARPASARLLPIAVPDPGGGPPWGLRFVATTRGLGCLQTGRLVRGMLGAIGEDGAFANDGRFHALPAGLLNGPFPCGTLDAHGNAFAAVSMNLAPASGLLTPSLDDPGCQRQATTLPPGLLPAGAHLRLPTICPSQDERAIYFGMAGPDATRVTYVADGQTRTVATVGQQGAYLIVLAAPGPGGDDVNELPGAGGGPIRGIAYRDGSVCVLRPDLAHPQTCPHVGEVSTERARPTTAEVAAPVRATVANRPSGKTLVLSFTARLAVTDASSSYAISIHYPGSARGCGRVISDRLIDDNTKGQREQVDQPTDGCRGTFRGSVSYHYDENNDAQPFDANGAALTVGTFTVNVP